MNMKKYLPLIITVVFIFSMYGFIFAGNLPELDSFLIKAVNVNCETLNKEIPLNIYYNGNPAAETDVTVIVYVMNHGGERIGTESDLSILSDYIGQGYVVMTADFGNDPRAVSPDFDGDLYRIFRAVYGHETAPLLENTKLKPKQYRCFFMPAGYRIAEGVEYWDITKHAVYGSLEYIMSTFNREIVGKEPGARAVASPAELKDRKGRPFDYKIRMDILYPSMAKKKVPLVYYLATQTVRNPSGTPRGYRPHMIGFTMRGYAYALIGHCFNPVIQHYWHFERFTLDHFNGLACYQTAIRYLRAHADIYNFDTRYIGGLGHSKGQYSVTRLSDPHNAGTKEDLIFRDEHRRGTPEPQPYPGFPTDISAGYQSMGMGLFRPQYITTDYAPTILACGDYDRAAIVFDGHANFLKYLQKLDANHVEIFMKELGHELPHGYDKEQGFDRYRLLHNFFDRYLKVEDKLPPTVLVMNPCDNKEDVLPQENISIHFAPVMDVKSIIGGSGVKIIRLKDNTPVSGKWQALYKNTKFIFTPDREFRENERYKIIVTTNVKNEAGTRLDSERTEEFGIK